MQVRNLLIGSAMLAFLAGCASGPTEERAGMAMDDAAVYEGTLQLALSSSTQALTARLRILLRVVARSPSPRDP